MASSNVIDQLAGVKVIIPETEVQLNNMDFNWALSLFDTSRLLTFVVSLALIVYGSFRAIKIESSPTVEDGHAVSVTQSNSSSFFGSFNMDGLHVIETYQALLLPFGASLTLLLMFFFFDSLQLLFMLMTAVLATVASSFLLLPLFQYCMTPCFNANTKISLGPCGRFTGAELSALFTSSVIVLLWVLTGHWLLMDALAMALCVAMIAFVRLPSLKVSVLLLFGLLVYDVFWVFLSEYIFSVNVMVKVATQPAYNPVNLVADKFNIQEGFRPPMKLSLPGKLIFPSSRRLGHFSMLGLGDVVVPGLLLCFVLRFDNYKKSTESAENYSKRPYFFSSLLGYLVGLVTATAASEVTSSAQPALLYLVPFTVLPLVTRAYMMGDLQRMWTNPFSAVLKKPSDSEV